MPAGTVNVRGRCRVSASSTAVSVAASSVAGDSDMPERVGRVLLRGASVEMSSASRRL